MNRVPNQPINTFLGGKHSNKAANKAASCCPQ
uniref:Uncharacterized protein n=1 Tax=Anguilla anguilla TaxID=7936 RepID=A0A0E9TX56_ANGAN